MNPFNKVEAIGIFLSIAVMALALGLIRFKTDTFALNSGELSESQSAVVAVSQTESSGDSELTQALTDATTSNGKLVELVIDDIRIGSGPEVKTGDTLTVHYIGTTQDGVRFDSSYERGSPFIFTVGQGKVISGWEKGLIGMKVGGQRILVIPSEMAYGNRQVSSIPPNSPLVFAVELLEIK
jgi:peptidylprolyl isomerase